MPSVTVGITAHHLRASMAQQLAAQVDATFVSMDTGDMTAFTNHVRCWRELADTGSEWAVNLEDDSCPVVNFRGQLEKALAAAPTNVVSLYIGRQRPPQWVRKVQDAVAKAEANDACYILANYLLHAVGVAIRTELITDMLTQLDDLKYLPVDEAIGNWCRRASQPIAYAWPSLIDHKDEMSLISHRDGQQRKPGRVAWRVGNRPTWDGERTVQL